jgi:hypothetical protein
MNPKYEHAKQRTTIFYFLFRVIVLHPFKIFFPLQIWKHVRPDPHWSMDIGTYSIGRQKYYLFANESGTPLLTNILNAGWEIIF